jgi:hypothetical protein
MSEALSQTAPARRRTGKRWIVIAGALLLAVVAVLLVGMYLWDRSLQEAIAETDRLDPGWRFDDLEAARAPVPDAENGAVLVLAAAKQMPHPWLAPPPSGDPGGLEGRLAELPLPQRPGEADATELRAALTKVAAAVATARGLADWPRGRYTLVWAKDLVGTLMPHVQEAREVARLLALDALQRAFDGDMDGAVRSCQAALNAGRSLGDEPSVMSQLSRAVGTRQVLHSLEQTLAQGEASAQALEDLQRLLAAEAEEPLQLLAARSDRVMFYQCLEVMRTGRFQRAAYGMASSAMGPTVDDLGDRLRAKSCQPAYLRYFNEVVEITKLPTEQQQERLQELREPRENLPKLLEALTRGGEWPRLAQTFHRNKAQLRCAAAAIAAERYRLVEGRWPESLDVLVPRYLAAVPTDPFDGQPLRLKRSEDGLVIYSVGVDRKDDGGNISREWDQPQGTDVGFRLWDVGQRGKPPMEK